MCRYNYNGAKAKETACIQKKAQGKRHHTAAWFPVFKTAVITAMFSSRS